MRISAFVITKDSARTLDRCLSSLDWASEVVVLDDFSTDATEEISLRHRARFETRRFTGFRDQKQAAMERTGNDWVLEIDSDEAVSGEMRKSILSLKKEDFERHAGFSFPRLTRFWGKWIRHGSLYPDRKVRLYDKRRGRWSGGQVHERFLPDGPVGKLGGDILHFQDLDLPEYVRRTARYADLSAEEYLQDGRWASWHHVTVRPLYTFLYRYLFRFGFLDGLQGVAVAAMGAFGTFLKYMRLYELQKAADPPSPGPPGQVPGAGDGNGGRRRRSFPPTTGRAN